MSKKLVFDTLRYATMLKEAGIEDYNAHASSLADVMGQNIYTKGEIDKMIDEALKRMDKRMDAFGHKLDLTLHQLQAKHDHEIIKIRGEILNACNRSVYKSVGLTSTIFVLVETLSALLHYSIH